MMENSVAIARWSTSIPCKLDRRDVLWEQSEAAAFSRLAKQMIFWTMVGSSILSCKMTAFSFTSVAKRRMMQACVSALAF